MATQLRRHLIGILLGVVLFSGASFAIEPAVLEKFVKARIDIGELMNNYDLDKDLYLGRQPPLERMREIGADINEKLSKLLSKYDLTVKEYREQSPEVFGDDAAVQQFLSEHEHLKQRYKTLPRDGEFDAFLWIASAEF